MSKGIRTAGLLLLTALPGYSQLFSVGVKAGVPLTDAYSIGLTGNVTSNSYNRRYIIGPTAEVHLPLHLSLEVDALYRRNGFNYDIGGFMVQPVSSRTAANDWQVPIVGKYELRFGPIRPFADAGIAYRHVSTSGSALVTPDNQNSAGFTVGGGVTLKLLLFRLSPEIRYTRWGTEPFNNGNLIVRSSQNQADFLVGFTF